MPFRLSPRARSTAWIHSAKHTTASPSVRDQITNETRTFPPGLSYILCPRSTVPVGAIHGRPIFLRIRTTHHPLSTSDLPPSCCITRLGSPRLGRPPRDYERPNDYDLPIHCPPLLLLPRLAPWS